MPIKEVVNYQLHNIFPTSVYVGEMEDHARHKEVFYREIYPKYEFPRIEESSGDINTVSEHEGKPIIHMEECAVAMMKEITKHIKIYYMEILGLRDVFDVYHTKSWISRSYGSEELIPEHLHAPAHISYAYYVNAPEGSHALSFYDKKKGNELFQSVLDYYHEDDTFIDQYTFESTQKYSLHTKEGTICIFPSKTPHGTDSVSEVFSGERLAISGDCIITLKESEKMKYSVGYINPKYWRTY